MHWSDAGADPKAVAAALEAAKPRAVHAESKQHSVPRRVLHQAAMLRLREQLQARHGEADRVIAQEIAAVDELVRSANLLMERLREWYGLHCPEAPRLAADAQKLATLISEHGSRDGVLAALGADATSVGSAFSDDDLRVVRGFASSIAALHDSWTTIEERVAAAMQEAAPNLSACVGPLLGARLIAQAGSLERLSSRSAGTVQTLGAETALFRHLKDGSAPPKHGVLYQHAWVHEAPPWQRGAMAKLLARNAVVAARADVEGADRVGWITERLASGRSHIQATKATAPKRPAPTQSKPRHQGPRGQGPRNQDSRNQGPRNQGRGAPSSKGGPRRKPDGKGTPFRRGAGKQRLDADRAFKGKGPAKPPGRGR